jgi:UDP-N-acetylglucosamine diphosphorylase / glucose-1-phosphate thymidylyltransferase / UDP-N-acetylgalactosamine diphosphorylase / glucosamine-1-phosphate N-acetyltransferase / galactosamine-1-phosphate N-acetyltransferase
MAATSKAVILAAGRGTRMGALTNHVPKPMLPIGPKPLLEHILDALREAGIQRFGIVIGYLGDLIEQHFARYPVPISWFYQTELNGTARALSLTRDFVGTDPFLLTFGDIWCEAKDYGSLIGALTENDSTEAVIAVRWVEDPWAGAAVYVDNDGYVTSVIEKPDKGTSGTNWNSAGLYAFRKSVMQELEHVPISPRGEYEIASAIDQLIDRGRKLRYYSISGRWHDVGRPEDLRALSSELGYTS